MPNEHVAKWVGRIFMLVLAIIMVVLVMKMDGKKVAERLEKVERSSVTLLKETATPKKSATGVMHLEPLAHPKDGELTDLLKYLENASRIHRGPVLGILHCHAPGNIESEQMADRLNQVAKKFGPHVQVVRADIVAFPAIATAEKVTQPPKVIMVLEGERVFAFQGLWPLQQINLKVEEVLYGIKRVDKDWRPEVKGMERLPNASQPTKTQLVNP